MQLTYKDLKALYSPAIHIENAVIKKFLYQILSELLPLLQNDIDWFINRFSSESKKSLDQHDSNGLLKGNVFSWQHLYLNNKHSFSRFNRKIQFITKKAIHKANENDLVEKVTLEDAIKHFQSLLEEFDNLPDSEVNELFDELSNPQDKFSRRLKQFIEASFANFFNYISLIENKSTITVLLKEALEENKPENFKKIFLVDPTVYRLNEVREFIDEQSYSIQSKISKYHHDALETPIISNEKNRISQKPLFFIGLIDAMGFINGEIKFSKKELLKLATKSGLDDNIIDQNYFNQLLKHVITT